VILGLELKWDSFGLKIIFPSTLKMNELKQDKTHAQAKYTDRTKGGWKSQNTQARTHTHTVGSKHLEQSESK